MRWDDLELLRFFDFLETQDQVRFKSGHDLLREMADGQLIEWGKDDVSFARELLLAHEAGYLLWRDYTGRNVYPTDPAQNANIWLQEIRDLSLTLAGRDRARGRIIRLEPPDPGEDDGRMITGRTLEEIARVIGDTYTAGQLPRYLRDSGIPADYVISEVTGDRWEYVFDLFDRLLEGGSAARRALRNFLGGWIEGRYHAPPTPEQYKRFTALLAQQGWHVRDDRLVIGDRSSETPRPATTRGRDARLETLHPDIKELIAPYLEGDLLHVAIFEAAKAVTNRVRAMSKLDKDGSALMNHAFSEQKPVLTLADLSTETGRNIQAGFRSLFLGAVQGIRNPNAHEQFQVLEEVEELEMLGLMSLLMRRLDRATMVAC